LLESVESAADLFDPRLGTLGRGLEGVDLGPEFVGLLLSGRSSGQEGAWSVVFLGGCVRVDDPALAAFGGPVVSDVVGGLVEVVGGRVDVGAVAGSAKRPP
jgi:hypothetical protein